MAAVPQTVGWMRSMLFAAGVALGAAGCAASLDIDAVAPSTPTPVVGESVGLQPGDCFTEAGLRIVGGATVPCAEPHIAEIYAIGDRSEPSDAAWPGVEIVQAEASDFCNDAFGEEFGVAGQISVLDILFFRPQEDTWAGGDREVVCLVQFPAATTDWLRDLDPLRSFGQTSTFGLEVGDCVADASLVAELVVDLVDCAEPHWFEVYASLAMLDGPYPGDAAVLDVADATCRSAFDDFVGVPRSESELRVERLFPTEESWTAWGDRLVTCVLSAGGQLTGSLAGAQR